ncbi:hypothetical protein BJ508DRAFT_41841 [Ascobolus immersus RN42]|uniref:Protein Zds1 C-terminal domain-containing protein n=1 Tax=Ascobolus immersus RN42 TaxID=1160509 RepID=A0A3N4IDE1_ASCIM|nr:hypothetical protein BJ508DRAFT_41841 [Ascobolus immersus RN42]
MAAAQGFERGFAARESRFSFGPLLNMYGSYDDEEEQNIQDDGRGNLVPTSPGGRSSRSQTRDGSAPPSPTLSLRSHSPNPANAAYPLNDIDYESNPAAVQQELNNLQALRRLSMDVSVSSNDPDLPSFNLMPTVAPTGHDSENDPSRLFWVPARLHPELAPKEFKLFVETKVKEIRGPRSDSSLSPDSAGSSPGLRRKKSMLSRQVDTSDGRAVEGFEDGAERLERRRSSKRQREPPQLGIADLEELDALVKDPSNLIRNLSLTSKASEGDSDNPEGDFILPAAPPGTALKRSTRTTYRRGSIGKDKRGLGRRHGRHSEAEDEEPPVPKLGIKRVQTEPMPTPAAGKPEKVSKAEKREKAPPVPEIPKRHDSTGSSPSTTMEDRPTRSPSTSSQPGPPPSGPPPATPSDKSPKAKKRSKSPARPVAAREKSRDDVPPVPKIVESPAPAVPAPPVVTPAPVVVPAPTPNPPAFQPPERHSSKEPPPKVVKQKSPPSTPQPAPVSAPPPKSLRRPTYKRATGASSSITSLNDIVSTPTLPGQSTKTTDLTMIPTYETAEDREQMRKEREPISATSSKKSGWDWFRSDKDKEKKEKDSSSKVRKSKSHKEHKASLSHDNTRLDVLQKSLEGTKDDHPHEPEKAKEKEKEHERRPSTADKKEKEAGLFSSIFGGSKKKSSDKDSSEKKSHKPVKTHSSRTVTPDPPSPQQQAYYYTRFPIHIERAIYRLSHLKLANPRRPLLQQVLLSNFMYSYLAKVQMHQPQHVQAAPQQEPLHQQQQYEESDQDHHNDNNPQQYYQYDNVSFSSGCV